MRRKPQPTIALDELALDRERQHAGLVLEPVARPDFDDFDVAWRRFHDQIVYTKGFKPQLRRRRLTVGSGRIVYTKRWRRRASRTGPWATCACSSWARCWQGRSAASCSATWAPKSSRSSRPGRAIRCGPGDARRPASHRSGGRSSPATRKRSRSTCARPKDKALLLELAAKADFLIENFRPGTLEKWNLGWEQLQAANPRLIMIRVSGYGQTGPYAGRAGFGAIGEAMGGLRYVVGDPVAPPSRVGISIGDSLAATFACVGALSALQLPRTERPRPGRRLGDLRGRARHDGVADHRVRPDRIHPRAHRRRSCRTSPLRTSIRRATASC